MNRVDQRQLTDLSEVCCNPKESEIVKEMLVNDGDYFGRKLSTNVSVPSNRKYLGVHITDENGDPIFFVWNVLFLGVADAAFIFTAVLKPVRAYIASMGIPCLIYLDDLLTLGDSEEEAKKNRDRAVEILSKTGFVVSQEKSVGPSSRLKYLGLEVCSVSSSFYIPAEKVDKIINFVNDLCQARRVKLRHFASFLGFLQSCSKALGPVVRMRTRLCYHWLMDHVDRLSYESHFKLSEAVREELIFWRENIHCLNGQPCSPSLSIVVSDSKSWTSIRSC